MEAFISTMGASFFCLKKRKKMIDCQNFQKKALDFIKSSGWDESLCKMFNDSSLKFSVVCEEGQTTKISGYMSTFNNVDRQGDVIMPGAFDDCIKTLKSLPMLLDHSNLVDAQVGSWSNFRLDSKGLLADGEIVNTPNTGHVLSLIKGGHLNTLSIGGIFKYANNGKADKDGVFYVEKIAIMECSVVSIPANPLATFELKSFEPKSEELPDKKSESLVIDENPSEVGVEVQAKKINKLKLKLGVFSR